VNFIKLMPLMGKTIQEITVDDLSLVINALNLKVQPTEELRLAAVELLKGRDIDSVADLIKSPESIAMIGNFIQGRKQEIVDDRAVTQCPHCDGFFLT
jgi:ribosomal protein L12E/L44/L45/RPP1/RPP2